MISASAGVDHLTDLDITNDPHNDIEKVSFGCCKRVVTIILHFIPCQSNYSVSHNVWFPLRELIPLGGVRHAVFKKRNQVKQHAGMPSQSDDAHGSALCLSIVGSQKKRSSSKRHITLQGVDHIFLEFLR